MAPDQLIGQALPRVEDERLLRGDGRYVDDIHPAGCLEAAFVRSPYAHARVTRIDLDEAGRAPGVVAAFDGATAAALAGPLLFEMAGIVPESVRRSVDPLVRLQPMPALATERVTYVGQPVAMVIADSRYLATGGSPEVTIWDCIRSPEGTTPIQLRGHEKFLTQLAYQRKGRLLASSGEDGRVVVWNPAKSVMALAGIGSNSPIAKIAWSPDDRLLAAGSASGAIFVVAAPE